MQSAKIIEIRAIVHEILSLKFGYNKASVKSTAFEFENCTGKKKHTLANKTAPKPNGTKNVPDKLYTYCDQTSPWQDVYVFTNTVKVGAE